MNFHEAFFKVDDRNNCFGEREQQRFAALRCDFDEIASTKVQKSQNCTNLLFVLIKCLQADKIRVVEFILIFRFRKTLTRNVKLQPIQSFSFVAVIHAFKLGHHHVFLDACPLHFEFATAVFAFQLAVIAKRKRVITKWFDPHFSTYAVSSPDLSH